MRESHTELAKQLSRLKAGIRKEILAHSENHPVEGLADLQNNICELATEIFLDIGEEFELKAKPKNNAQN